MTADSYIFNGKIGRLESFLGFNRPFNISEDKKRLRITLSKGEYVSIGVGDYLIKNKHNEVIECPGGRYNSLKAICVAKLRKLDSVKKLDFNTNDIYDMCYFVLSEMRKEKDEVDKSNQLIGQQ